MTAQPYFTKDPDALLDYVFDWKARTNNVDGAVRDWLIGADTIGQFTLTADVGITVVGGDKAPELINDATAVRVWLSGGVVGKLYRVTCRITTAVGREDDRSIFIQVEEE